MNIQKQWTERQIQDAWELGTSPEGMDDELFRVDAAGALMRRDAYGKRNRFGWEIDEPGGTRPLFWKNALARGEQAVPRKFFRYHGTLELNVSHFFADDI